MKKPGRRIGVVCLSLLSVLLMFSSSSVGYTFSVQHERTYWTDTTEVDPEKLDAVQTFYNYNGNGFDILAEPITGWSTRQAADGPEIEVGKYLIFHAQVDLYTYWGENEPQRDPDCVRIYCSATLELSKWENDAWVTCIGNDATRTIGNERDTEGSKLNHYWLHVWEDAPQVLPGMQYRLYIYVIGGWEDAFEVLHPDPQGGESSYTYYEVTA